jgi:hypothetical protein
MKDIREAVVKIAERVTVADLCQRSRKLNTEPVGAMDFVI